jgi:uncharacterized membrane protein YgcG
MFLFTLLVLLVCICMKSVCGNDGHFPENIANPMKSPLACNRPNVEHSSVCDVDDMLSDDSKDIIEGMLNKISDETIGEAAVCYIYKMDRKFVDQYGGSIERAGDVFAHKVHDSWGVGDHVKNNGILLFVSIHDRMVYVSTGSGVDNLFPRLVTDGIVDHMKPHLRNKDYSLALQTAITEIDLILQGKGDTISSRTHYSSNSGGSDQEDTMQAFGTVLVAFVLIATIVLCFSNIIKNKDSRLNRGQNALNRLMREVNAAESGEERFHSDSCPICLEDFAPSQNDQETGGSSTSTATPNNTDTGTSTTPSNSDTTSTSSSESSPQRAMMLRCEHQFCFGCLEEYLKTPEGRVCPICRAPVDTTTGPQDRTQHTRGDLPAQDRGQQQQQPGHTGSAGSGLNSRGHNSGCFRTRTWEQRQPEYLYRLSRMQYLYPEVVTSDTYTTLSTAARSGAEALTQAIQARSTQVSTIISDRARRAKMASSGSSGSSRSSFGGGRSSGGGGGRW